MKEVATGSRPRRVAATLLRRAGDVVRIPLYRNALVLLGNSGLTAGLGFIFWSLAARLYPPAEVGLAAAAISAALFVSTVSQLGLTYALVRFLPGATRPTTLTTTVVLVVMLVGVIGGAVFAAGMGTWAPALGSLAPTLAVAIGIMALAGATNMSTALVYVGVGVRDTRSALVAGATHGTVKAVLIFAFALAFPGAGFALLVAWLIGTVAAVAIQVWLLRAHVGPRVDMRLLRLSSFLRYSAGNYIGDLGWTAPSLLYPLLVVGLLGAEANAYFYLAWAVASLLTGIPTAVASSLLAEGSHEDGATGPHVRRAVLLNLGLMVPAVAVCWVAAPLLLGLFGGNYAAEGVDTLRVLTLAALPMSLNTLGLTIARVDRAIGRIIGISYVAGVGALLLSAVLAPEGGGPGIAWGYFAAQGAVAVVLAIEWWRRSRATAAA